MGINCSNCTWQNSQEEKNEIHNNVNTDSNNLSLVPSKNGFKLKPSSILLPQV